MDKLSHYRQIIHQILTPYSQIIYNNADIQNRLAFDTQNDQYLVISEGWQHNQRYHDCLIHLEIINEKIWVQCDNTEDGITKELLTAGIPKDDIVLGFHEPKIRQYTGFAIA